MSLPARGVAALLAAAMCLIGPPARGDIYGAEQALAKQDLPRAFDLYRELAELGRADAQEIAAVMYVNGEGVKRDNALGYAWAPIALSNDASGKEARNIVDQLESHMTPAARMALAYDTLSRMSDGHAPAAAQATFDGQSKEEGTDSRNCRISAKFYLAALLAAGPDGVQLDAARALTLVEDVRRDMYTNPILNEIRAAAYAGLGKFDDARQSESKALGMAKRLGWNTVPLEARLAGYQKNQPWRGNFFLP